MNTKERGLYGKYYVERTDGKSINGPTFTLELWRDPLSLAAYRAYIDAARGAGYAALADDMSAVLREAETYQAERQP